MTVRIWGGYLSTSSWSPLGNAHAFGLAANGKVVGLSWKPPLGKGLISFL